MSREKLQSSVLFEQIKIIEESDKSKKKPMKIEGIAGKAGIINANNRLYPLSAYTKAVEKAQSKIKRGKLLGEVDHPDWGMGTLQRAAFKFTKLWMDGDLMKFEGIVLSTPAGQLLETLLRDGVGVGVSTRGYATIKYEKYTDETEIAVIQDDFELAGIDFVLEESNPYGTVTNFESKMKKGGIDKMKLTLESLKKDYPDLVKSLRDEIEKELKESIKNDIMDEMNKDLQEKLKEAKEEGRKEAMESEEVKNALAIIAQLKESLKVDKTDEELKKELDEAKKTVKDLQDKIKNIEEERNKYKSIIEEQKAKEEKEKAIEEAVKDYPHADLLRQELEEYATAEEVKKNVDKKKQFIESILAKAGVTTEPAGKGVITGDEDKNDISEDVERLRRLAGIL